jgi:hypothetical protein
LQIILLGAALFTTTACSSDPDHLLGGGGSDGTGPGGPGDPGASSGGPGQPNDTPPELACTAKPQGRSYIGFDGTDLGATRVNENMGINRARIKPYAALASEYQRALGLVPPSLAGAGDSFDAPPARWFAEAKLTGVSLAAIFDISFEGCITFTKDAADYAAAPDATSAPAVCTSLMKKAWSRTPSPEETAACVKLATTQLASETNPRRQWAYVCASVLSSSNFLTF